MEGIDANPAMRSPEVSAQEWDHLEQGFRLLGRLIAGSFVEEVSARIGSFDNLDTTTKKPEKPVLSVREVAQYLGLSVNTVYEAIRQGEIPTVRFGTRILVPRSALVKKLGMQS